MTNHMAASEQLFKNYGVETPENHLHGKILLGKLSSELSLPVIVEDN